MREATANRLDLSSGWLICQEPPGAPGGWAAASDFDDSGWRSLAALRHLQLELFEGDDIWWGAGLREMNSTAWVYRLHFDLPEARSGSGIDLDFGAVDYFAEVWLNGRLLGEHEGNFAPFSFPIEAVALPKGNALVVRVRAPFGKSLGARFGWVERDCAKGLYEHSDGLIPPDVNPIGIWRPVSLVMHNGVRPGRPFVDTLKLSPKMASVRLRCPVECRADVNGTKVRVVIRGETFKEETLRDEFTVDLAAGANEITRDYDLSNPNLWTVWQRGTPHLYRVDVEILFDGEPPAAASGTFGVRTVELARDPYQFTFRLNGEPLFIKGTGYLPSCYLSDVTEGRYRRDIELAKQANCNLLRAHVHIGLREFYDICDREGVLIMQDFELNWQHPHTAEFERRILPMFRDMIEMLRPHPSVAFWICYNEPNPHYSRTYDKPPAPALYEEALRMDTTRPVFLATGHAEDFWEKSGDSHYYDGSLGGGDYWMFLEHKEKFNTEYGCTAPGAKEMIEKHPKLANAVVNTVPHIDEIWDYQYRLIKFCTENYRRQKYNPCGGCVHFMLADMFPQTGLGVVDFDRNPKGGFRALAEGFAPIIVVMEHRETMRGLWVANDLKEAFPNCLVEWRVTSPDGKLILSDSVRIDVPADGVAHVVWFNTVELPLEPGQDCVVELTLKREDGSILATNRYVNPFRFPKRPNGYPDSFNEELGIKTYTYRE